MWRQELKEKLGVRKLLNLDSLGPIEHSRPPGASCIGVDVHVEVHCLDAVEALFAVA
jgi:hypothetical protein